MIEIQSKHRFKSIKEFQFIPDKQVGCGSFGVVRLARHRITTRIFAVKIITVKNIPSEPQIKLFQREIAIHSTVDHPHIVKLWDTLLQDDCIYMVMDYAQNGNLFNHQNSKYTFTEPEAFRFFSQTLQGVSYMHQNDIIHRDLKPENLLVDGDWNIKICDLGWAAQDINVKRTTFCGTYQYMAPEMLFKAQYDHHVDIWALGILLYELLHGHAPFKGKSVSQVQEAILKGSYQVDPNLSESVQHLITNILQVPTSKRLTLNQISNHPWVKEMESHINAYLKIQNIFDAKQIYLKVSKIPAAPFLKHRPPTEQHRKNNSMNFVEQTPKSANPAQLLKKTKHHHSYEKENNKDSVPMISHKQVVPSSSQSSLLKKNKMLAAVKTQMSEMDMTKSVKSKKSTKIKDMPSFDKDTSEMAFFRDLPVPSKKKQKNAKSQVEYLAEKYPIRFHTEACQKDDWQPRAKLKKSHLNSKMLRYNRSGVKLPKSHKIDIRY